MFRSSYKICAVVVLVLAVPPAVRGALYEEHCDDLLPQVLNVGLPHASGLSPGALRDAVNERLTALYAPFDQCGGRTRLQVNIAVGNDYQILDWLGQGLIDVAVVPDLSLYLLGRDGVELLEPPVAASEFNDLLVPLRASVESRSGEPERDFESFRWQLWCGALTAGAPGSLPDSDPRRCSALEEGPEYRIAMTSHLSTGGFLRPVSQTAVWLADRAAQLNVDDEEGRKLTDRFWTAFFHRARFTLDGAPAERRAAAETTAKSRVEIAFGEVPAGPAAGPIYRNHLVITARAAASIFYGNAFPSPAVELPPELKATLEADPAPAAFQSLLAPEPYFGVRTFGFTVEETVGLLRQHQTTSGRARLALVLPGGGVKAVYQSQLVDSLYASGYLKNSLTDRDALAVRKEASPLDVDFVIGTSGGALLGYFVSRLAENGPWNLSEVLWQNKDEEVLDSTDIFGWTDLPRYLSVVAVFLVFSSLLFVGSVILRKPIPVEPPATEDFWRPRLTLGIVPLLLLTPVLVRWVNGQVSQEHIPEIEGLFYAICASAAIFADQCLVYRREPRPNGRLPLHPVLPLLLGLVLVAVPLLPLWGAGEGDRWLDRRIAFLNFTVGSLLVCLGVLSLLAAGILWTYASRHYRLEEVAGFRAGFSLSLLLVAAVYGVLGLVIVLQPDLLSPLELTAGFWKWLLATSLVLGVLIVVAGCAGRGLRWSRRVFSGLRYLCSHHPNSSLVSRRFLRIAALAIGAFLWWNFVLAPALYGNGHARAFLDTAEDRFHRDYRLRNPEREVHQLTAHLVVPANVLERDGTRFFLVVPNQAGTCPLISSKPGSGALWYTYRIRPQREVAGTPPRGCPNFRERQPDDVEEVIFASGSPFPIFPAHLVELTDEEGNPSRQALVDGGYSNNEPVDAALNVGAEQVLIVESTNSLGHASAAVESGAAIRLSMLVGPLVADLLRLPGFLFERSQQVDRLSRRGLFVVSLAPSRDEADWPPLFDFRRKVVERLRNTAKGDLTRRIGLVESWGPPRFQLSVLIGKSYA